MSERVCRPIGLTRPRFFDRQVIYADDLSLEQSHHDRQVARLNRYLHGWGIVAGFGVATAGDEKGGMALRVEPGYAVTPNGEEVYLPEAVVIEDLPALARAAGCDCAEKGCEDPRPGPDGEPAKPVVYLVARPGVQPGGARPAAPEGCGHPGGNMQYGRWCSQVCLQVVCQLQPPHAPTELPCADLEQLICGPDARRPVPPLPAAVDDTLDYVVLAAVGIDTGGEAPGRGKRAVIRPDIEVPPRRLVVSLEPRRLLLPMETLQQWLQCLCLLLRERVERPEPPPEKELPPDPPPRDTPEKPLPDEPVKPPRDVPEPPIFERPIRPPAEEPEPPVFERPIRPPSEPAPVIDPVIPRPVGPGPVVTPPIERPAVRPESMAGQPVRPRPVREVAGVGPARAARLNAAGVDTVAAFTALSVVEAATIMEVSESTAAGIMERARKVESSSGESA